MVKFDATLVYITQLQSCDLITSIISQKKKKSKYISKFHPLFLKEIDEVFLSKKNFFPCRVTILL